MGKRKKVEVEEAAPEVVEEVEAVEDEIVWMDSATGHKRGVDDPDPK